MTASWKPKLTSMAVLRHDSSRNCELLLLPERVVTLNDSAAATLSLCDGTR
jgi:pyrroloquinoline quinone biosynthesis protein D